MNNSANNVSTSNYNTIQTASIETTPVKVPGFECDSLDGPTDFSGIPCFLSEILSRCISLSASDVHIVAGEKIYLRVGGSLTPCEETVTTAGQMSEIVDQVLTPLEREKLFTHGSVDGAISPDGNSRFRFNLYRKQGSLCIAFRLLENNFRTLQQLGLDEQLYEICDLRDGLVLVAGPTGSGKSTTLATLINRINQTRAAHVITIEDPVEYIHYSNCSLVNQRQVGTDVPDFPQALIDAMRQDPDVILVGELRDLDTTRTAISAAETGHLVFASVHAGDSVGAIERLISAFPAEEQNLAQRLVATVLRTVIVQHLLPLRLPIGAQTDGETNRQRVLASEVLQVNTAVSNLISSSNLNQIATIMESSAGEGMWTLDKSLAELWEQRKICEQTAKSLARNPSLLTELAMRKIH